MVGEIRVFIWVSNLKAVTSELDRASICMAAWTILLALSQALLRLLVCESQRQHDASKLIGHCF